MCVIVFVIICSHFDLSMGQDWAIFTIYTKRSFINLIDTLSEGERERFDLLQIFDTYIDIEAMVGSQKENLS